MQRIVYKSSLILISAFLLILFGCKKENEIALVHEKTFEESLDQLDADKVIEKFNFWTAYFFDKNLEKYKELINECNADFVRKYPGFDMKAEYNGYLASLLLEEVLKWKDCTIYKFRVAYEGVNKFPYDEPTYYYYVQESGGNKISYSFKGVPF